MFRRGVALLAFALVAGCVEPAAPPTGPASDEVAVPAEAAEEADRTSRQGGDAPGQSFELVAATPGDLTDVLELHWAYTKPAGHLAIELVFDFGKDNDCRLEYGQQTIHSQAGPNNLMLGEYEGGGVSWGTGSSGGGIASVHAAGVDTRSSGGGGGTGHLSGFDGPISGTLRVTFVSVNWEGWGDLADDFGFLPGDVTAAVSATCEDPFSLTQARSGASALLAGPANLEGGAGAEAYLAGGANVQDSLGADLASPAIRATCDGFGLHAGRATLTAPSGETTWTFLPSYVVAVPTGSSPIVEDGAGTYTFSADRAGAYFEAFWCAAWGFDADYDPLAELRPSTVIDSPFD